MNQEEMKVKLEEAMKDEAFVKELEEAPDAETARKAFKSKGIEFTTEEVEAIAKQIRNSGDELGEDQLEAVSGGIIMSVAVGYLPVLKRVIKSLIKW